MRQRTRDPRHPHAADAGHRALIIGWGKPIPFVRSEAERLIVEVDGYAYHGSRDAFRRDRRRDAALTNAGLRVVRFTWEDLTETPQAVLATIAQALVVR